ncbi:hypothetical protein D3C72_1151640 [compost metagenome]
MSAPTLPPAALMILVTASSATPEVAMPWAILPAMLRAARRSENLAACSVASFLRAAFFAWVVANFTVPSAICFSSIFSAVLRPRRVDMSATAFSAAAVAVAVGVAALVPTCAPLEPLDRAPEVSTMVSTWKPARPATSPYLPSFHAVV